MSLFSHSRQSYRPKSSARRRQAPLFGSKRSNSDFMQDSPVSAPQREDAPESFSTGGLSPISDDTLLGHGAPIQAKKPYEYDDEETEKMNSGKPFEEEYRPLSQRTYHMKPIAAQMSSMDGPQLDALQQKMDNMGERFETLKQDDDKPALYDFMMKASSLLMVGTGYGDFQGDMSKNQDVFSDGITTMMTDPLFASKEYLDYVSEKQVDIYHLLWDTPKLNDDTRGIFNKGTDLLSGTYNELTAPVTEEQKQLLPKTLTNYNTGLETKGTPAEKKLGLMGWLKKKLSRK